MKPKPKKRLPFTFGDTRQRPDALRVDTDALARAKERVREQARDDELAAQESFRPANKATVGTPRHRDLYPGTPRRSS